MPLLKHATGEIVLTTNVHEQNFKYIKFDYQDDLTPFMYISKIV